MGGPAGLVATAGKLHADKAYAWFTDNRRLTRRYERTSEHVQAFADLAAILICRRRLAKITN